MTTDPMTEFFGEPICTYTDEQAIEDGVLVHPYPERWPWLLITASVHAEIEEHVSDQRNYTQCLVPLLMDCIMLAQSQTNTRPPLALEHTIVGTVWICPNGKGGMTVMKPSDY